MNQESAKILKDSLFTALNLFNNHKWYEAHDAFEEFGILLMETKDKSSKGFYKYLSRSFT